MDNKKYSPQENPWPDSDQNEGLLYSRPTSAPPVLEPSKEQLVALQLQKTKQQLLNGINDIRLQPDYERFYERNQHLYPFLPPPVSEKDKREEGGEFLGNAHSTESKFFPEGSPQTPYAQNGVYPLAPVPQPPYETPMYATGYPTFPPPFNGTNPGPLLGQFASHPSAYGMQEQYGATKDNEVEYVSEPEAEGGEEDTAESQVSQPQPKSAAIDIKQGPIWNPMTSKPVTNRQRNKNFGKVAINMDTNLSSSTDDLLKLAGGGPLQRMRVRFPSYEESPPNREPVLDNPPGTRGIRMYDTTELKSGLNEEVESRDSEGQIEGEEDISEMVHGYNNMSMGQTAGSNGTQQQTPTNGSTSPQDVPSEKAQTPPICRYFANGFCSRGDRCNYLHVEQNSNANGAVLHKTRFKHGRVPIPASRYANLTLEECVGEIASMCLDQHGCRYLQRQLDTDDPKVIETIFKEVNEHMVELMSDPFGNYMCQKLIEHCTEAQRLEIVKTVAGDLVQISKNMHGTRAVQKLIEHLGTPDENKLIRKALKGSVVALIQDLNGNHVIQKCLHKMEPNDNQFIYDAVAQHCVQVSTHRHGCCVMQRCIDHATHDQKLQLVEEIKKTALALVQDAFGNYVVQYALDLEIPTLPTDLIKQLHSKLHYLSKQKFSSNVVEKCLRCGAPECVARVLREFLGENPDGTGPTTQIATPQLQQNLIDLLQDSFGNYVIQTCLSEGATKSPAEYLRMSALLRPYVHNLRNAPYIKRIHNLLSLPTSIPSPTTSPPPSSPNGSNGHTATRPVPSNMVPAQNWVPVGGVPPAGADVQSPGASRRPKQRSNRKSSLSGPSGDSNERSPSNGGNDGSSSPSSGRAGNGDMSADPAMSMGVPLSDMIGVGGINMIPATVGGPLPVAVQPLYYPYPYHPHHHHMHPIQYQQMPYYSPAPGVMESPTQPRQRPQPQHIYQQQYAVPPYSAQPQMHAQQRQHQSPSQQHQQQQPQSTQAKYRR